MGLAIFLSVWVGLAVLTARIAYGKGRDPVGWFVGGILFPLPALIAALVAGDPKPRTSAQGK